MLTVIRLGLPIELRRSLACTNIIENMMGTIRRVCRNVKRWRDASMALRWTGAAMQEAAKGFRRLKAHKQLPVLRSALAKLQAQHSGKPVLERMRWLRRMLSGQRRPENFNFRRDISVYLILGAFILAAAMVKTRLADRITYLNSGRIGASPTRITLGVTAVNIILAFLVPSTMARTAILLPVCLSIIGLFRTENRSRFAVNLLLTLAVTNATISAGVARDRSQPGHGRVPRQSRRPRHQLCGMAALWLPARSHHDLRHLGVHSMGLSAGDWCAIG